MFYGPWAHVLLLKSSETMRNYAKLCETMRNYTKLYETMRNYASWTPNSEQMCLFARACAQNIASRNSPPNPANPAEVASGPQLATPLPRAGGQDDVSLKETLSNYRRTVHYITHA